MYDRHGYYVGYPTTKVCNIGRFSKTFWAEVDAIIHLRSFATDLDVKCTQQVEYPPLILIVEFLVSMKW